MAADLAKDIQYHDQFSSKVSENSPRLHSTDTQLQLASFRLKKDSSPEVHSKRIVLNIQVDCQGHMHSYMNIQSLHHLLTRPTSVEYTSPRDCHCLVMIPLVIRWRLNAMTIVIRERRERTPSEMRSLTQYQEINKSLLISAPHLKPLEIVLFQQIQLGGNAQVELTPGLLGESMAFGGVPTRKIRMLDCVIRGFQVSTSL
jgi:hypothetical protein